MLKHGVWMEKQQSNLLFFKYYENSFNNKENIVIRTIVCYATGIGCDIMLINKAYKFSLYSNELQKEIINKTLDCSRLIYNHYLNKGFKNKRVYMSKLS